MFVAALEDSRVLQFDYVAEQGANVIITGQCQAMLGPSFCWLISKLKSRIFCQFGHQYRRPQWRGQPHHAHARLAQPRRPR